MRWDDVEPIRDLHDLPRVARAINPVCAVTWGVLGSFALAVVGGIFLVLALAALWGVLVGTWALAG